MEESFHGNTPEIGPYPTNDIKEMISTNVRFWCGNLSISSPEIFFTKSNKLELTFATDNRFSDRGFEFAYEENTGKCIT